MAITNTPEYSVWYKKESRYKSGSLFDNPKTNLTYEKNLCLFQSKYRAKTFSNAGMDIEIKNTFFTFVW